MKDIPGHEGRYAINEDGTKVYSYPKSKKMYQGCLGWTKEKYLSIVNRKHNYKAVTLSVYTKKGRKPVSYLIHRLVAITYLEVPAFDSLEINHKDKNPANNHYSNLEWVTRAENIKHSWANGKTMPKWKGLRIRLPYKLSIDQIKKVRYFHEQQISASEISRQLRIKLPTIFNVIQKRGCYSLDNETLEKMMIK